MQQMFIPQKMILVLTLFSFLITSEKVELEKAYFGGGCFWCTEAVYNQLNGVTKVEPGYSGGNFPNPTYEDVCSGETGHAEVISIEFDPKIITFDKLLEVFFEIHNPTTMNQQGADIGTQYRSIILYTNNEQKNKSLNYIDILTKSKKFPAPIVTEVVQLSQFYKAENFHVNYYQNNKLQPYCQIVIKPKLIKFKSMFQNLEK